MTARNTANAPIFQGRNRVKVKELPDGTALLWVDCLACSTRGCFDCDQWGGWWVVPDDDDVQPEEMT